MRLEVVRDSLNNNVFLYVPYGTIGYVKTINNEVRQCMCLGGKANPYYGFSEPLLVINYEWKVAGYEKHFFTNKPFLISIGAIYSDEQSAQNGSAVSSPYKNTIGLYDEIDILGFLAGKYGISEDNISFKWFSETNPDYSVHVIKALGLETYHINSDRTLEMKETDFEISVGKNGVECVVPMLEGEVNGERRFAMEGEAYESAKPLKTYLLGEGNGEVEKNFATKIKLTIEVEIGKIDDIREIATILK